MKRVACALAAMAAAVGIMAGGSAKATILYTETFPASPPSCTIYCGGDFSFGPLAGGETYYFYVLNEPDSHFSGGLFPFKIAYAEYDSLGSTILSGVTIAYPGDYVPLTNPYASELIIEPLDAILPSGGESVSTLLSGDLFFSVAPQSSSFTVAVSDNLADVTALSVPEPGTWLLMILGAFGCGMALRRKRLAA